MQQSRHPAQTIGTTVVANQNHAASLSECESSQRELREPREEGCRSRCNSMRRTSALSNNLEDEQRVESCQVLGVTVTCRVLSRCLSV